MTTATMNVTVTRIPVALSYSRTLSHKVSKLAGRKKNLRDAIPTSGDTRLAEHDCGRYSSRCTYRKYEYTPVIRSYATLDDGVATLYSDVCDSVSVKAPKGYRWEQDDTLVLVRNSDGYEYHVTDSDLCSGAAHCRSQLLENRAKRKAIDAAAKKRDRDARRAAGERRRMLAALPSILVTYDDSRRAGNCQVGTTRFARMLGIDGDLNGKAVSADRIMALAARSGHSALAERAVLAAWQRATEVSI